MIDYALTTGTLYLLGLCITANSATRKIPELFKLNREIFNELDEFFLGRFYRAGPLVYIISVTMLSHKHLQERSHVCLYHVSPAHVTSPKPRDVTMATGAC